jgi:hypothetical protein
MTVPKRFGVLRFFAGLIKVIAWIVLIISALVGIVVALISMVNIGEILGTEPNQLPIIGGIFDVFVSLGGGIILGILSMVGGVLYFIVLYAAGELISMNLAIEENTRLTAALLLRMHQESQPEARSASSSYGGAGGYAAGGYAQSYASEPFESGS